MTGDGKQSLIGRQHARIFAGPDTWTPTNTRHPLAFDSDRRHPNFIGAEIMAHYWFESLLKREGLEVPAWSLEDAIQNKPLGLIRDNDIFQQKLQEWKIVRRRPAAPQYERSRQANRTAPPTRTAALRQGRSTVAAPRDRCSALEQAVVADIVFLLTISNVVAHLTLQTLGYTLIDQRHQCSFSE